MTRSENKRENQHDNKTETNKSKNKTNTKQKENVSDSDGRGPDIPNSRTAVGAPRNARPPNDVFNDQDYEYSWTDAAISGTLSIHPEF